MEILYFALGFLSALGAEVVLLIIFAAEKRKKNK